jgi:hypothetical protein
MGGMQKRSGVLPPVPLQKPILPIPPLKRGAEPVKELKKATRGGGR